MTLPQQFGVALAANTAVVILLYPALRLKRHLRIATICFLGLVSILSPCAISNEHSTARLIAALITSGVFVKLYDLAHESVAGRVPSLRIYIAFVENSFWHVLSRRPTEGLHNIRQNLRLFAINALAAAIGLYIAINVFYVDWLRLPFVVEHVTKVLVVYAVLAPGVNGLAAGWRLLGQPALATMNHPELARTPADFWRRWNRPTQIWFHEYFFQPAGGRRAPIRATLFTFAVSGLVHEYVFGIAVCRFQGVQMCFFMLQGLAVVATMRLRPSGWRAIVGVILTLTFNLATALLFFKSANAAIPFYAPRGLPLSF